MTSGMVLPREKQQVTQGSLSKPHRGHFHSTGDRLSQGPPRVAGVAEQ